MQATSPTPRRRLHARGTVGAAGAAAAAAAAAANGVAAAVAAEPPGEAAVCRICWAEQGGLHVSPRLATLKDWGSSSLPCCLLLIACGWNATGHLAPRADADAGGGLLAPCRCSGSQRFVHERCLGAWMQSVVARKGVPQARRCDICRAPYRGQVRCTAPGPPPLPPSLPPPPQSWAPGSGSSPGRVALAAGSVPSQLQRRQPWGAPALVHYPHASPSLGSAPLTPTPTPHPTRPRPPQPAAQPADTRVPRPGCAAPGRRAAGLPRRGGGLILCGRRPGVQRGAGAAWRLAAVRGPAMSTGGALARVPHSSRQHPAAAVEPGASPARLLPHPAARLLPPRPSPRAAHSHPSPQARDAARCGGCHAAAAGAGAAAAGARPCAGCAQRGLPQVGRGRGEAAVCMCGVFGGGGGGWGVTREEGAASGG